MRKLFVALLVMMMVLSVAGVSAAIIIDQPGSGIIIDITGSGFAPDLIVEFVEVPADSAEQSRTEVSVMPGDNIQISIPFRRPLGKGPWAPCQKCY